MTKKLNKKCEVCKRTIDDIQRAIEELKQDNERLAIQVYATICDVDPAQPFANQVLAEILCDLMLADNDVLSEADFLLFAAGMRYEEKHRKIAEARLP